MRKFELGHAARGLLGPVALVPLDKGPRTSGAWCMTRHGGVLAGNWDQDLISWNKRHIKTCVVSA